MRRPLPNANTRPRSHRLVRPRARTARARCSSWSSSRRAATAAGVAPPGWRLGKRPQKHRGRRTCRGAEQRGKASSPGPPSPSPPLPPLIYRWSSSEAARGSLPSLRAGYSGARGGSAHRTASGRPYAGSIGLLVDNTSTLACHVRGARLCAERGWGARGGVEVRAGGGLTPGLLGR